MSSTFTEVELSNTIKGSSNDTIEVLQLNDDSVMEMEMDKDYILILGKQSSHENTYYVKGGTQGIFEVDGNSLTIIDDEIHYSARSPRSRAISSRSRVR